MGVVITRARLLLAFAAPAGSPARAERPADLLPADRLPPVEHAMRKLEEHPVVVLGEGHSVRHDAELVTALGPPPD